MRRAVSVAATVGLVAFTGCTHKYAVPPPWRPVDADSGVGIYVALAEDGRDDGGRVYDQSGRWTSDALANALAGYSASVQRGVRLETVDEARARAAAERSAILVYPKIEHWSDRATEWSGVPDRITLRIRVLSVDAGSELDDRRIRASSRWATFGGDHPQELLPELTERWAASLSSTNGH